MKTTVSEKGQVTIPKALRDRLGILPGQELVFEEDGGRIVVRKASARDPVDAVYGVLALERGTDAFLAAARGPADGIE
jgi:antitoxin PrlF